MTLSPTALSPVKVRDLKNISALPVGVQKCGDLLIDVFRQKLLKSGTPGYFTAFRRALREASATTGGKLTPTECSEACEAFGFKYHLYEMEKLYPLILKDNYGRIGYHAFVEGVRPPLTMRLKNVCLAAFHIIDSDCDGFVSVEMMEELFDAANHPEVLTGKRTIEDVQAEFSLLWDKDHDAVSRDEFIERYNDLWAAGDCDDLFELTIRNTWHVSGGEGVSRNTSCLRVLVTFCDDRQQIVELRDDLRLDRSDMSAIHQKLTKQGVESIARIQLESETSKTA